MRVALVGLGTVLIGCSSPSDPCGALAALGASAQNGAACAVDGGIGFVPEGYTTHSTFPIAAYLALAATADGGVCARLFDAGICNAEDAMLFSPDVWSQEACFASAGVCSPGSVQTWMDGLLSCLEQVGGCCNPPDLGFVSNMNLPPQSISTVCTGALLDSGVL